MNENFFLRLEGGPARLNELEKKNTPRKILIAVCIFLPWLGID